MPLELVKKWRTRPKNIVKYQFVHHFFPINKNRATLFSVPALIVYCLIMFLAFSFFYFIPKYIPGVLGYASDIRSAELLKYTNEKRASIGLPALQVNSELSAAAKDKAKYMLANNFWAHVAPDGTQPWDFIIKHNYDYSYAGENLAKNFNTSKEVVEAWYQSPSHRDNLLNKNYNDIGFAVVDGVLDGYETTLVVQMFGRVRGVAALAQNTPVSSAPVSEVELLPQAETAPVLAPALPQSAVFGAYDISSLKKYTGVSFLSFMVLLLVLDIWYSAKNGVLNFAIPRGAVGHTYAHLFFLLVALAGVWLVLTPGKIL